MAYACPVCETPQADGRHLANHLAFTAMIHGDDHEAWLDEHAPKWEQAGERALAKRVVGEATETDLAETLTDPTDGQNGSEGSPEAEASERADRPQTNEEESHREESRAPIGIRIGETGEDGRDGDGEIAAILAEARELTERMGEGNDISGDRRSEADGRDTFSAESRDAVSDGTDGGSEGHEDEGRRDEGSEDERKEGEQ